jgi:hypothetical protein
MDVGDALVLPACHDNVFRLREKGAGVSTMRACRGVSEQRSGHVLVCRSAISDKARIDVEFGHKLRDVVHGWWEQGEMLSAQRPHARWLCESCRDVESSELLIVFKYRTHRCMLYGQGQVESKQIQSEGCIYL